MLRNVFRSFASIAAVAYCHVPRDRPPAHGTDYRGGPCGLCQLVGHSRRRTDHHHRRQLSDWISFGSFFHGQGRMTLDLEMVPSISDDPRTVSLTVDPGLVWSISHGWAAGGRVAFDVNSSQFGFIPLLNKSWKFKNDKGFFKAYFIEADLPVKFNRPPGGPATNSVTFATHFGLGF